MTKVECEVMADYLRDNGVSLVRSLRSIELTFPLQIAAAYYHAGQPKSERKSVQSAWLQEKIKVVCATIAYGQSHLTW